MTNKAYIVANEQQECEVLEKLERDGFKWLCGAKPTEFRPSKGHVSLFPYVIYVGYGITWNILTKITSKEIVYDGRKKSKMKISKQLYDALVGWRRNKILINNYVWYTDIESVPEVVKEWWIEDFVDTLQTNNRLIAIISWVNGEDVFEVEKPKKWVVRSKVKNEFGYFGYVALSTFNIAHNSFDIGQATTFDTKEEAESWANSHQEVVEVEE